MSKRRTNLIASILILSMLIIGLSIYAIAPKRNSAHFKQRDMISKAYSELKLPESFKQENSKWVDNSASYAPDNFYWEYTYLASSDRATEYRNLEGALISQGLVAEEGGSDVKNSILYRRDKVRKIYVTAIFKPQQDYPNSTEKLKEVRITVGIRNE